MVHSLTVVLAAVAVLMAGAKKHGHMKAFRHGLEVGGCKAKATDKEACCSGGNTDCMWKEDIGTGIGKCTFATVGVDDDGNCKATVPVEQATVPVEQTNNNVEIKDALRMAFEQKEQIQGMVPICPETLEGVAVALEASEEDGYVLKVDKYFKLKQATDACQQASFAAMALTVLEPDDFADMALTVLTPDELAMVDDGKANKFPTRDQLANIGKCEFAILNGKFSAAADSKQTSWKVVQCEEDVYSKDLFDSLVDKTKMTLTAEQKKTWKNKLTLCKNKQGYASKKYDTTHSLAKEENTVYCATPDLAAEDSAGDIAKSYKAMKEKVSERAADKAGACTPTSLIEHPDPKPVLDYENSESGVPAIFKAVTPDGYTHIYVRAKAEACVLDSKQKGDIDIAIYLEKEGLEVPALVYTYKSDGWAEVEIEGVQVTAVDGVAVNFQKLAEFKIGDIQVIACTDSCDDQPGEVLEELIDMSKVPMLKAFLDKETKVDGWRGDEWIYFSSVTSRDASFRLKLMLTPYSGPCEQFAVDYSWHQYDNCEQE